MKRFFLLASLLLFAAEVNAEIMVLYLSDGTQKRISTSEVKKISFSTAEAHVRMQRHHPVLVTDMAVNSGGRYLTLMLDRKSSARVEIYNAYGRIVRSISLSEKTPGMYRINLNSSGSGKSLPGGFYFAKAVIGDKVIVRNFITLR
ncbi:MAG: hypothetical protein JW913_04820 [Chitinispirillaceae bacterium]|nr:hypothetical protein [Chitinispirillaceae bacterium]